MSFFGNLANSAIIPRDLSTTSDSSKVSFAELPKDEVSLTETPIIQNYDRPVGLKDALACYPVTSVIASYITHADLLSLALTSKSIHILLGQTGSKEYWRLLWSKNGKLKCQYADKDGNGCTESAIRCVRCREGFCSRRHGVTDLLERAENRLRKCCQECVTKGYNPVLTAPPLFGQHTLRQLLEAKKWSSKWHLTQHFISVMQKEDVTFCPNEMETFDLRAYSEEGDYPPYWQVYPKPETYNPAIDRIREYDSSRCMCIQIGGDLAICQQCTVVGVTQDYGYNSFGRSNYGICECGTVMVDFLGEGVIIPGTGWKDDESNDSHLPQTAGTSDDTVQTIGIINQPTNKAKQEKIVGLCSWCGFRVYERLEKGDFPANGAEYKIWKEKRRSILNNKKFAKLEERMCAQGQEVPPQLEERNRRARTASPRLGSNETR